MNQAGRDGSGCPNQNVVIQAGANIPPTVDKKKELLEQNKNGKKKLTAFFGRTKKFDKNVLNQILAIWQTQNALPWAQIEDFHLQAGFHYAQPGATLYRRKWAATESKKLFLLLQMGMLDKLKVNFKYFLWLQLNTE